MLAKRLHLTVPADTVAVTAPHADWSAHTFTVNRFRYIILTNSYSLLSVVLHGSGITSDDTFIRASLAGLRDYMDRSGRAFAYETFIAPAAAAVRFARIPDRRIMGSINELVFLATVDLVEGGLAPAEVTERLSRVPMSMLWRRSDASSPDLAFDQMPRALPDRRGPTE
ncbi:MAG: hypothetical protein Q7S40_26825 [Opitutaceae bacterium]|nr:hypothetical protein [Opitutaceae bacterium]